MDRIEKIKLIRDLMAGREKITDVFPGESYMLIQDPVNNDFFTITYPDKHVEKVSVSSLRKIQLKRNDLLILICPIKKYDIEVVPVGIKSQIKVTIN